MTVYVAPSRLAAVGEAAHAAHALALVYLCDQVRVGGVDAWQNHELCQENTESYVVQTSFTLD